MKTSLATLALFATLMVVPALDTAAQQRTRATTPKDPAALETSLGQLGQALKESVARRSGPFKRWYVRLKERGGCDISFQESVVQGLEPVGGVRKEPINVISTSEWRLNLSDLDPAAVKIESFKGAEAEGDKFNKDFNETDDYQTVSFATTGGKELIRWKRTSGGWLSEAFLTIGSQHGSQVAAALQQAIIACRR